MAQMAQHATIQPDMVYQVKGPAITTSQEKQVAGLGNKWTFGLFNCFSPFSICLLGTCCPCILFGQTQSRLKGETDPSCCNILCCAYYCAMHIGCAHGIVQTITRGTMRDKYAIAGDGCTDCLSGCFCSCCALVQEEKEALLRTTHVDPTTGRAYQAPEGMSYP